MTSEWVELFDGTFEEALQKQNDSGILYSGGGHR